MNITSTKDLKFAYSFRRFLQTEKGKLPLLPGSKDCTDDLIREMSEAIHKYNRKQALRTAAESDRRIVKDYGIDGFVLRIDLPEELRSKDEARAWFEEYEVLHYRPTYYDCTGQLFTQWYSIFKHPTEDHFIAYHSVACDC